MGQFMDQNMRNNPPERHIATMYPFLQNGPPEKPYCVGLERLIEGPFLGQRDSVIKPGQLERVVDAQIGKHRIVSEILDPQDNSVRDLAHLIGERLERCFRKRLERRKIGRSLIGPVHVPDMDKSGGI